MAETVLHVKTRFKPRSDTALNWSTKNPVLLSGEPGFVKDGSGNEWLKFGDGVHQWNDLPWFKGPKGDKGDTGAIGSQGPKGDTGAQGKGISYATISNGNLMLTMVDPATGSQTTQQVGYVRGNTGATGPQGPQGVMISRIYISNGYLYIVITNPATGSQTTQQVGYVKGDTGSTGAQGPKGDKGDKGDSGYRKIADITVSQADDDTFSDIEISVDENNNAFSLSEIMVYIYTPADADLSSANAEGKIAFKDTGSYMTLKNIVMKQNSAESFENSKIKIIPNSFAIQTFHNIVGFNAVRTNQTNIKSQNNVSSIKSIKVQLTSTNWRANSRIIIEGVDV